MEIDDYEIHSDLVEKFLLNGDKIAFKKMLNMNLNNNNNKLEKQKENLMKKLQFMKSMKPTKKHSYYNHFYLNQFGDNNHNTFKHGDINSFKLDFHNFYQDPEYKDKCMKGNYKWANMKFQMMKANLAKRKGIPIEELKMPKIWSKKKSTNLEMNGNFVMNNDNKYRKYNSTKKMNLKEDNKNSLMDDYSKKTSIKSQKINDPYKRQYSQRISNTFNI